MTGKTQSPTVQKFAWGDNPAPLPPSLTRPFANFMCLRSDTPCADVVTGYYAPPPSRGH